MTQPLPPPPPRIAKLPKDHRGFPVPWFATWFLNGEPCAPGQGEADFRVADSRKLQRAISQRLCWVCGEKLGNFLAFTIGPMCAVNRVTSEPPSHSECALFSAQACPFLVRPRMRRNTKDLPEQTEHPAGFFIERNPAVVCVWITKSYSVFRASAGGQGTLIKIGEPTSVFWFAEGKEATRAQVEASIESGMPLLMEMAEKDGAEGITALTAQRMQANAFLPEHM